LAQIAHIGEGGKFGAVFRQPLGANTLFQAVRHLVDDRSQRIETGVMGSGEHGARGVVFASAQPRYHYLSTARRMAGILLNVHSVLLRWLLFFQTSASRGWIE
jgi:hypothetical protein